MNTPDVPEDLTTLGDDDLHALATSLQSQAQAMSDEANDSDEALATLETLAGSYQQVIDELAAREEASQARTERVQQALSKIGATEAAPENGATEAAQTAVAVEATTNTPEELTVSETTDTATGEGEALGMPQDPATSRLPSDETPSAVGAEGETTSEETAVAEEVQSEAVTASSAIAQLSGRRPASAAPRHSGERRAVSTFVDNGLVDANGKGKEIDRRKLAELICRKHSQLARMSASVSYEPITLASATADFDFTLGSGHEENFSVIQGAIDRKEALVASGGNCAPLSPNWDVFNVAEVMSPIERTLPSIGAPRGGIRYVQPPLWPEAQAGVRFTTNDEDAAGYTNQSPAGTTAPKPCVHLECRPIVECQVDAVSQCVTFGNLQYRTFPEQVEVFLEHLAVAFAQAKEINYLDAIEAGSTAVNVSPDYGATRGTVYSFALAAHAYRKRNHMGLDATLDLLAPDTMLPLIKADMVADLHMGLGFLDADPETVSRELFNRLNLNVEWYYDYSTNYGSTAAMQQAQAAGPLNAFPQTYRTYFYAPGTWVRLDGGTLDVGIVRDSTLNSQNDLQIFSEEFVQVCKVGIESVRLDLNLCPSGTGPSSVTALHCAS